MSSALDWLREAQKGYVAKTPQQMQAERAAMNFQQLRAAAGAPPSVAGCEFYDPAHGHDNSGGAEQAHFDSCLSDFKKGLCPPPFPMYDASHPDATASGVRAYNKWFAQWGNLLHKKWKEASSGVKPIVAKPIAVPAKPVTSSCTISVCKPPSPPVEDLADKFRQMWLQNPVFDEFCRDTIYWGDLDLYDEEIANWEANYKVEEERRFNTPVPEEEPEVQEEEPVAPVEPSKPSIPAAAAGIKTLITRNLPRDISVEQLRKVFERYGPVKDIYIPKNMDKNSPYFGTIKGFALVKFIKHDDAIKGFQEQFGRLVFGRNPITIEFAKEDR